MKHLIALFLFPIFCYSQASRKMEFVELDHRTTMVTAYYEIDNVVMGANYLVVEGDSFSVLLDTPWDDDQTRDLLAWADTTLKTPITTAIITHSHNDRMGGIAALHERDIETYIHPKAQEFNDEFEPANHTIETRQHFDLGNISFDVYYPGDGHAPGNLVVLFGKYGVYGGCYIKSGNSRSIGNTADADLESWRSSLLEFKPLVENAVWIIPGHGSLGGQPIERTLELLDSELD